MSTNGPTIKNAETLVGINTPDRESERRFLQAVQDVRCRKPNQILPLWEGHVELPASVTANKNTPYQITLLNRKNRWQAIPDCKSTLPKPVMVQDGQSISTSSEFDDPSRFPAAVEVAFLRYGELLNEVHESDMPSTARSHGGQITWMAQDEFVERVDQLRNRSDPPLSLIVKIAREVNDVLDHLIKHPRQVLRRDRRLVPVEQAKQLDSSCIRWLARQPGRNLAERAEPEGKIMAVVRDPNWNTLENRVLKHFLELASREVTRWKEAFKVNQTSTHRYARLVLHLGKNCQAGLNNPLFDGLEPPPVGTGPNYVLQFDRRYQKIWKAYQMLVQRKKATEELWRWRHRAWRDIVLCDLLWASEQLKSPQHKSPNGEIGLRMDPDRGSYLSTGSSTAPIQSDAGWFRLLIPREAHIKDQQLHDVVVASGKDDRCRDRYQPIATLCASRHMLGACEPSLPLIIPKDYSPPFFEGSESLLELPLLGSEELERGSMLKKLMKGHIQ